MTKKQKIGISLAVSCAVLMGAVCLLLPRSVHITADLARLESRGSQYGTAEEMAGDNVYYNSPNWEWWFSQWTGRDGMIAPVTVSDDSGFSYVAVDEAAKRIEIVCQSYQGDVKLKLKGFQSTPLGSLSKVKVTVESVRSAGEMGSVYHTTLRQSYAAGTEKDTFTVRLEDTAPEDTYHIVITPSGTEEIETYENERLPLRYEAEEGKLKGDASIRKAKLNNSGYVTGIEGDSTLTFRIKAEETGSYKLNIIYAYSGENDGASNPYAGQYLLLDGEQVAKMNYAPTGSDKMFAGNSITLELDRGTHDITLKQASGGAAAIDCIDVTMLNSMQEEAPAQIYQGITDAGNTNAANAAYLLPVPADGYYDLTFYTAVSSEETAVCSVDGTESSVLKLDSMGETTTRVYLRKGINYVQLPHRESSLITGLAAQGAVLEEEARPSLPIERAGLTGKAAAQTAGNPAKTECVGGVTTPDDSVSFTVTAPSAGTYRLSFSYAASVPAENALLNISVNGQEQQTVCENTFSESVFRSQTLWVELAEGENTVKLYGGADSADAPAIRLADVKIFLKCLDKATD